VLTNFYKVIKASIHLILVGTFVGCQTKWYVCLSVEFIMSVIQHTMVNLNLDVHYLSFACFLIAYTPKSYTSTKHII